MGLEVVPTGYILIETGATTSVEYMSNTKPIPSSKPEIVVATALAGEMLGHKMLYFEGGSGTNNVIDNQIIKAVKESVSVPIMVGGGVRTTSQMLQAFDSGADIVVLGTILEEKPTMITDFCKALKYDK